MRTILVRFDIDRMGNITAVPVSEKHQQKYADYMKKWEDNADGSAFFQEGGRAYWLLQDLPKKKAKELEERYSVTCRIDPYIYGIWLGYDAYNVIL